MIVFDQLRISNDGQKLYIDLHVNYMEEFDNVFLDTLVITTEDNVSETNSNVPSSGYIFKYKFQENLQAASLVIDKGTLDAAVINVGSQGKPIHADEAVADTPFNASNFSQNIFFVYVSTTGTPAIEVPCSMQNPVTMEAVFNEYLVYQKIMEYTKMMADICQVPMEFVDFILRWDAFKASINTGHYIQARNFYRQLFEKGSMYNRSSTIKPCRCHG